MSSRIGRFFDWVDRKLFGYTRSDVVSLKRKIREMYRTGDPMDLTQWEAAAMHNGEALPKGHMIRRRPYRRSR